MRILYKILFQSGRTHSEQAYKMIEFLQKRGPDAFDNFCEILQEDYPWIAKLLRESLETESERILVTQCNKEESPTEPCKFHVLNYRGGNFKTNGVCKQETKSI